MDFKPLCFLSMLFLAAPAFAQSQNGPQVPMTTRMALSELSGVLEEHPEPKDFFAHAQGQYPVAWQDGRAMVGFLGKLPADGADEAAQALEALAPAVRVGARRGGILSFRIDALHLDLLAGTALAQWQMAGKATADLEKARYGTRADSVQAGLGLPQAFTGQDVLVGVVDWGFDYTHPMFYDAALTAPRVRGIWDQFRQEGPGPSSFGYGRMADSTEDIASLAADTSNVYGWGHHGTHVAGIAAGAGAGLNLIGMAPEAQMLFASFLLDESAAMDAFAWMQEVAEADGKRLVINCSWSLPQFGTKDGQGLINQFMDAMSEQGVVFVVSAGNNGNSDFHLSHAFDADTMRTRVQFYPESAHPSMWGQALTIWGDVGAAFDAGFMLTTMGSDVALESPWYTTENGPFMVDSMLVQDGDTVLFDLAVEEAHPANGRPFARFRIRKGSASFGIGLQVAAPEGLVHCWNTTHLSNDVGNWGQEFMSTSDGWLAGDPEYGVQSPACSESVIAVAAYYSEYLNPIGNEGGGTLANFTTHGPTIDGRLKPEIAAPGLSVESSISSFSESSFSLTSEVEFNGINYPFAKLSGTSMSAPAVAGIVALMLEANPALSVAEVRAALKLTAREDDHTGDIPAEGSTVWGWGKVNAVRAVQEVLGINDIARPLANSAPVGFEIWPNPVGAVLHVQPVNASKSYQWTAVDVAGKVHGSGRARGVAALNTRDWPTGVLLLRLTAEDGMEWAYRLIVE
ncbi:S8 family peptidase [Flavobacteriales bacterium]|nr:S8 family peptidase [Flavobacteriales bacterium]